MARKKPKKPTPQQCIDAIIARDSGMPYEDVLETFEITPNQLYKAVEIEGIDTLLAGAETHNARLAEIFADPERQRELFNMGEAFVRAQYDRIRGNVPDERQAYVYRGTYAHHANVEAFVYYALAQNDPDLASSDRARVISAIQRLPTNLAEYLHGLGLAGLMTGAFDKDQQNSPLAVLDVFDQAYQARTGDKSLFDLTQETHLHKWGDNFSAPNRYWQNPDNVREAVYHTLTEAHPLLSTSNRTTVIQELQNLPTNLQTYLRGLGLAGLMMNAFGKGQQDSPLAVLEVFNQAYRERTGDKSLFDLSTEHHLHRWGDNFKAPHKYWKNHDNVKEAVYHALTEANQNLASQDRTLVISAIQNLPINLAEYLHGLGLAGLMMNAFDKGQQCSPFAVLDVFDQAYQARTGDKSLFDRTQPSYVEVDGSNRIIRAA